MRFIDLFRAWLKADRDSVPSDYLDGCTFFPDAFGKVSHKSVCTAHDAAYWHSDKFAQKLKADWLWFYRLNRTHITQNNPFWWVVTVPASVIGLVGITTVGSIMWARKDRFKNRP